MKDYLNSVQRNHFNVIGALIRMMNRVVNVGNDGPRLQTIIEAWAKYNNLTKDEQRSLKTAQTYLEKFYDSVYSRLSPQEQERTKKQLSKFDFRLVDDFTVEKLYRDFNKKDANAVVPREQFNNWTREIMDIHCKDCKCHYSECPTKLYEIFEDNFIPESTWNLDNCKYAYQASQAEVNSESVKKTEKFRKKLRVI